MSGYPRVVRLHERRAGALVSYLAKLVLLPAARARRRRLRDRVRFVGITGSAGKTTTKRLTTAVLAAEGPTLETPRGGNRPRRLAPTLLKTTRRHRFCVLELAAFGPGTMDELLWTTEPDVAVLTNAGWDHLSAFGGPEGAAREKGKLVAALPPDGTAVLNADDALVRALAARAPGRRVVLYGTSPDAEVRAEHVGLDATGCLSFSLVVDGVRRPVRTQLLGTHWLPSVLAALATGRVLGVDPDRALTVLAATPAPSRRLTREQAGNGITLLRDDFKASVWTVEPALRALAGMPASRRVAIFGQLADDPRKPRQLYRDMARLARRHADLVVLVGAWAHHGLRARTGPDDHAILAFSSSEEAREVLRHELRAGDVVLLKSTRGHLDVDALLGRPGSSAWADPVRRGAGRRRRLAGGAP